MSRSTKPSDNSPPPVAAMDEEVPTESVPFTWDAPVRMVGDRFFMWDMAKLWGLACLFLSIVILALGFAQHSPYTLKLAVLIPGWAFVGFYVLSLVIALVFYLNKYYVQYVVTDRGVRSDLVKWSGTLSKAVASGNLVVGALKSSPLAAGVGLLADTQRSVFMPWEKVRKVTTFPGARVLTLSNSWRPVVRLHCPTDEIYRQVVKLLETRHPGGGHPQ